ncbi:Bax inhibitor-1/YccA family protein [Candidatus Bandiella numerosa]|uniref:Bax inhibitor-1/YccA family protein n=1 Tax=Candidatus Bandiella numerosa TaxID=2570586 RepID=UPI001F23A0EB|nr:Bax inhibitor-1/YccA family protein [Candidatus Bandiella numerosa]
MNFDNVKSVYESTSQKTHYDWGLREYLLRVYQYMAFALALTALISMGAASSTEFLHLIHATPLKWIVVFAPLGMAFYMGSRLMSMSVTGVQTCLMIFATLMGLSLSSIFIVYTGESIAKVFFITASTFGAMSIYGHSTKRDLTNMRSFLIMGVIGILIASVVNIFMQSGAMQFVISVIGVGVFTLLTAYDAQKIKTMYYQTQNNAEVTQKLAIYGSLTLYMDFINLFVFLLQLFGVRKND